jgi:hypothetical protein
MLSGFGTWCNTASAEEIVQPSAADQSCASGVRLRAVQFDPNDEQRSFAMFGGSPRSQLRRGARVSGYAIERIEQGAVVLASGTQRCTVRLRGAVTQRELRAIPVEEVRSALRARTAQRAPLVTRVSTLGKLGS